MIRLLPLNTQCRQSPHHSLCVCTISICILAWMHEREQCDRRSTWKMKTTHWNNHQFICSNSHMWQTHRAAASLRSQHFCNKQSEAKWICCYCKDASRKPHASKLILWLNVHFIHFKRKRRGTKIAADQRPQISAMRWKAQQRWSGTGITSFRIVCLCLTHFQCWHSSGNSFTMRMILAAINSQKIPIRFTQQSSSSSSSGCFLFPDAISLVCWHRLLVLVSAPPPAPSSRTCKVTLWLQIIILLSILIWIYRSCGLHTYSSVSFNVRSPI